MDELQQVYQEMLDELESQGLEVNLLPAPRPSYEGHMVRVCYNRNVGWYRKLCDKFRSGRKRRNLHPDTRIRRQDVIVQLKRLIAGKAIRSYIADEVKRVAQGRISNQPF